MVALMWRVGSVAALGCLVTGLLPLGAAEDVARRMAPILVFLVAITVLAELAEVANIFDIAAVESARLARGRTGTLFLLVAALATATTVLLGLDTTAVLLTPVVLSLAVHLDLPPMPFALLTVWLANTASLLLPVSNLTNLLALDQLGPRAARVRGPDVAVDRRVRGAHRAARRRALPTPAAGAVRRAAAPG